MITIGEPALWQDVGLGLLLMALALVAGELLARYAEVSTAGGHAGPSGLAARSAAGRGVIADELR